MPCRQSKHVRAVLAAAVYFFALCLPVAAQPAADSVCGSTATGDLEIAELASKVFENRRALRVWLPPGYRDVANASRRYPVLYLLDGQNLFDACTSLDHLHEWRVDETLSRLIEARRVPPLIVVGIDHAGVHRTDEYLPYPDTLNAEDPDSRRPHGALMPQFMEEVVTWTQARYRVRQGPEHAALGGSSYAAVAALYVTLQRPDLFSMALLESMPTWVGNGQLLRDTASLPLGPRKVYLGLGGRESPNPAVMRMALQSTRRLEHNLRQALYRPSEVHSVIDPQAEHGEVAWSNRFPGAVSFLFGSPPPASYRHLPW